MSMPGKTVKCLSFLVLAMFLGCQSATQDFPPEDRRLKGTFERIFALASRITNIPVTHRKTARGDGFSLHFPIRSKFVQENERSWRVLISDLEKHVLADPTSRWADDAVLCIGMWYLVVSLPEHPYTEEALQAYRKVLKESPNLTLEAWTRRHMPHVLRKELLEPSLAEPWTAGFTERQLITWKFQRALVVERLQVNDFGGARQEHQFLRQIFPLDLKSQDEIRALIERWEAKT